MIQQIDARNRGRRFRKLICSLPLLGCLSTLPFGPCYSASADCVDELVEATYDQLTGEESDWRIGYLVTEAAWDYVQGKTRKDIDIFGIPGGFSYREYLQNLGARTPHKALFSFRDTAINILWTGLVPGQGRDSYLKCMDSRIDNHFDKVKLYVTEADKDKVTVAIKWPDGKRDVIHEALLWYPEQIRDLGWLPTQIPSGKDGISFEIRRPAKGATLGVSATIVEKDPHHVYQSPIVHLTSKPDPAPAPCAPAFKHSDESLPTRGGPPVRNFSQGGLANLAQLKEATADASESYLDLTRFDKKFLNDGYYSDIDTHAWIAKTTAPVWAQIDLKKDYRIRSVAFSSDSSAGSFSWDRLPDRFTISIASDPKTGQKPDFHVLPNVQDGPSSVTFRSIFPLNPPQWARYIKIDVIKPKTIEVRIDEIEVYGELSCSPS